MRSDVALKLKEAALEYARIMSDPERAKNYTKEAFLILEIIPLSEHGAAVVFVKPETGKRVAVFFFWMNYGANPRWSNFTPTDSHILAMESFGRIKAEVEKGNYARNFRSEFPEEEER